MKRIEITFLRDPRFRWSISPPAAVLALIILFWTFTLATFALVRHQRLNSSAYDLAIYSQVVWNTSQGELFASSLEVNNFLGDHVAPILLLLAPLYWLWPGAETLLVVQALFLCLGAMPIYHLARRRLLGTGGEFLPLILAVLYLLYPAVGFMARFDFHSLVLATPALLWGWEMWERGRVRAATLFIVLALLCNEEVGLTVFALGLYVALVQKQRRLGLAWAMIGLAWSLCTFFVVIPYFRQATNDVTLRYAWLGDDVGAIGRTLLTQPGYVIRTQLGDPLRQQFLLKLLLPLGFLSLLSPAVLAIGLPCLGYNLLSAIPSQSSIYFHYIAPLVPFIFIAAADGIARLHTWLPKRVADPYRQAVISGWLTLAIMVAWFLDNPFTHPIDDPYYAVYAWQRQPDQTAFEVAHTLIPPQATVATTMAYAPHLTARPTLDLFYHKGVRADQVYDYLPADYLFLNLIDLRWGVNPRLYYAMIETAIGRDGYEAVFFRDEVALFTHTSDTRPETGAVLQRTIDLQEAGGKYAPTGQGTIDWVVGRWVSEVLPEGAVLATVPFAEGLTIRGYEVAPAAGIVRGGPLCATIYWDAAATLPTDYTVFVHLRDATGYVHAQRDNVPVLGFYPTSQWQPGQLVGDMHCMQLPSGLPAGVYELAVGLYNPMTGARLPLADGTADAALFRAFSMQGN